MIFKENNIDSYIWNKTPDIMIGMNMINVYAQHKQYVYILLLLTHVLGTTSLMIKK